MKKMCLGTMITIIYQSRARKAESIKSICKAIFASYGLDITCYDKALPSHLCSGRSNVPCELVDSARNTDINNIFKSIETCLLPLIADDKRKNLFRAIKQVLREDANISDTTKVGVVDGYEKESILNHNSFYEAMTLANIITYSITQIDNNYKNEIKEIDKDFVDSFSNSEEKIEFLSPKTSNDDISPLKRTLNDSSFNNIFKKAFDINISCFDNPTTASVYYIDPSNSLFRFRQLKNFIINNISSYVFSRAKTKDIIDSHNNEKAVGSQAMLKFLKTCVQNSESVLGELLLYIFLEEVLDAPKIMTKIELDDSNRNIVSKSDGIHILSTNELNNCFHQLVFGASNITGNLRNAVDRVFSKIVSIDKNYENEFEFIDNRIHWTIDDPKVVNYLVKLLVPQQNKTNHLDMAFGVFLGYTIKLNRQVTNNQEYRDAVKEQLQNDIQYIQSYIEMKIKENGLSGYSFYFYLLPFNDADSEKISIIQELLSGD